MEKNVLDKRNSVTSDSCGGKKKTIISMDLECAVVGVRERDACQKIQQYKVLSSLNLRGRKLLSANVM